MQNSLSRSLFFKTTYSKQLIKISDAQVSVADDQIRFRVNRILEDASDPFIKKVVGCHNDGSVAVDRRVQSRGRFCLMIVKENCSYPFSSRAYCVQTYSNLQASKY